MFSKPRTSAIMKGWAKLLHSTDYYLLNQVILKDSQPCIINYLTNLKEIIELYVLDKFVEAELQAR